MGESAPTQADPGKGGHAPRKGNRDGRIALLKLSVAYLLASIVTLPFLGAWWWSELPVLAVFQAPKILLADWLRTEVVMEVIKALGFSSGSYSPDYSRAGPYALATAYLVPLAGLLALVGWRTRFAPPYRRWTFLLLGLVVVDFALTLVFRSRPGLSIY